MFGIESSIHASFSYKDSVPSSIGTAILAGYNAATPTATTRIGSRYATNPNSSSANIQRAGMMFTSEDLAKNCPLAIAYFAQRVNYCSAQMSYIPDTGDAVLDDELKEYLQGLDGAGGVWATMNRNGGMQGAFSRTADIELPMRGDAGMVWVRNWAGELRLMEFSADQLGQPYMFTPPRKCGLSIDERTGEIREVSGSQVTYFAGIYMDNVGDPIAYLIYERIDAWYGNPKIYGAWDVYFFQDPSSLRGIRGVTLLAGAMQHMDKGEALFQTGMDAAIRQSKTAMAVYNGAGAPDEGTYESDLQYSGQVQMRERVNGSGPLVEYFFTGDKVENMSADSPGPELIQGCEFSDERVALALRVNYTFLVSPKRVGGAPARLDIEKVSKEFSRIQETIHRPKFNAIRDTTIKEAIRKRVFRPYKNIFRGRVQFPISASVDAFNDAKADIDNLRSGLESPQDLCAQKNRSFSVVMRQKTQAASEITKAVQDANEELEALGYDGTLTKDDVMQLSENPQQQGSLNEQKGTDSNNKALPTAKLAAHDVSDQSRDKDGKWTSHGSNFVPIDSLTFDEPLSKDVTPLSSNHDKPIIVKKDGDKLRILDGYGRASGLKNAGKDGVHAIIVSDSDLAKNKGAGDDPEWVGWVHTKYDPSSKLASGQKTIKPKTLAYEMSFEQYAKQIRKRDSNQWTDDALKSAHGASVKNAIRQGKKVPEENIKVYLS